MSEGQEMYEGIESTIEDLISYYKELPLTNRNEDWRQGALDGLRCLLKILNS